MRRARTDVLPLPRLRFVAPSAGVSDTVRPREARMARWPTESLCQVLSAGSAGDLRMPWAPASRSRNPWLNCRLSPASAGPIPGKRSAPNTVRIAVCHPLGAGFDQPVVHLAVA